MRPNCPDCSNPIYKVKLTEEISGYRYCRGCSTWWHDNNKVLDSNNKPVKNPFNFSVAKSGGDPDDPSNPGGYLSSVAQKFIENAIKGFYEDCRIRSRDEVNHLIYRLAEIYDVVPGKIRVIYDRTRTKGYNYSDRNRTL